MLKYADLMTQWLDCKISRIPQELVEFERNVAAIKPLGQNGTFSKAQADDIARQRSVIYSKYNITPEQERQIAVFRRGLRQANLTPEALAFQKVRAANAVPESISWAHAKGLGRGALHGAVNVSQSLINALSGISQLPGDTLEFGLRAGGGLYGLATGKGWSAGANNRLANAVEKVNDAYDWGKPINRLLEKGKSSEVDERVDQLSRLSADIGVTAALMAFGRAAPPAGTIGSGISNPALRAPVTAASKLFIGNAPVSRAVWEAGAHGVGSAISLLQPTTEGRSAQIRDVLEASGIESDLASDLGRIGAVNNWTPDQVLEHLYEPGVYGSIDERNIEDLVQRFGVSTEDIDKLRNIQAATTYKNYEDYVSRGGPRSNTALMLLQMGVPKEQVMRLVTLPEDQYRQVVDEVYQQQQQQQQQPVSTAQKIKNFISDRKQELTAGAAGTAAALGTYWLLGKNKWLRKRKMLRALMSAAAGAGTGYLGWKAMQNKGTQA